MKTSLITRENKPANKATRRWFSWQISWQPFWPLWHPVRPWKDRHCVPHRCFLWGRQEQTYEHQFYNV